MVSLFNTPTLLFLSNFVFCAGIVVVLTRKNTIFMLIGIELMLVAGNLNLVLFSHGDPAQQGPMLVLFVMTMVVCETAVALAIIFKV